MDEQYDEQSERKDGYRLVGFRSNVYMIAFGFLQDSCKLPVEFLNMSYRTHFSDGRATNGDSHGDCHGDGDGDGDVDGDGDGDGNLAA